MSNALTAGTIYNDQQKQFQGLFSHIWAVNVTNSWDTDITAAAEVEFTVTVPGVALGDMVIGYSSDTDPEENIFFVEMGVSAANTLAIGISNLSGSNDRPTWTNLKVLIGRPNW